MEATERSEEDACLALYECDNDLERAVIYLLENLEVGALITTTKKKKTKAASDGNEDGNEFESSNTNNRDSNRDRGGDGANERFKGRISNRGGASNRGRSRVSGDSRANDGGESGNNMRGMRGRGDGTRRGGFSGRGRGGGRGAPRGRDPNNHRMNNFRPQEHQQEIDNWDPTSTQITSDTKNDETWGDCGDWDNEEYTGSLSDTKVFTPSTQQDLSAPPGLEQQILNPPQSDVNQYNPAVVSSGTASGQYVDLHSSTAAQQLRQALEMPSLSQQPSAPLSAEQSQYFNTLGTQNSNAAYQSSVQYQYNDQVVSNQQAPRSHQQQQQQQQAQAQQQRSRARVPPPSKIPSSAVEMPDVDLPVYLDVQFGGLDFGTGSEEPTYETEKYSQGLDQTTGDDYTANKSTVVTKSSQSALGGLQPSQLIQTAESISSSTQADLSNSYSQRNASSMGATGQSALDQLTKTGDIYASGTASGNAYQNLSYQSSQKSGGYQTSGYGSNAYNSSQSANNYPASTNTYGGYNQNSYQPQNQSTQSGTAQQQIQSTGSVSSNSSNPNQTTSG